MKEIKEYTELKSLLGSQLRSKKQINGLFEADCEIVKVGSKNFITTSTDSLGEEISMGLYKNVETWAWLTVMSSVSDLAASGTSALGLTLSTQWAFGTDQKIKKQFFAAVKKACVQSRVPLLGGDSGYAQDHVMTSSVIGHSTMMPLTRLGAKAGDYLVLANYKDVGIGPALALRFLTKAPESYLPENIFRPTPSWQLAHKIRPLATAAIDTSDGLAIGLYTLANLNDLGFEIHWDAKINHAEAMKFCMTSNISPIMLWLGDLGDLQTLFVVPKKNIDQLPKKDLTVLGQFTKNKNYTLKYKSQSVALPLKEITKGGRDVDSYDRQLKNLTKYLAPYN